MATTIKELRRKHTAAVACLDRKHVTFCELYKAYHALHEEESDALTTWLDEEVADTNLSDIEKMFPHADRCGILKVMFFQGAWQILLRALQDIAEDIATARGEVDDA